MSRLFISLYLDEDVSTLVTKLVRSRGFEATTTVEAGQLAKSDAEQLAYAVERQLALLTHNRVDFEILDQQYRASGLKHYGIIVAVRRPAHEITRRLLKILNHVTADELENQLRYI